MRIDSSVGRVAEDAVRSLYRLDAASRSDPASIVAMAAALAESVADRLIDELVALSGLSDSRLGSSLLKASAPSFHQSWQKRHELLSSGFGISVRGRASWRDLDVVVQVRNALMHGQGFLTDMQVRNAATALKLSRRVEEVLGSQIQAREILLGEDAGERAVEVAAAYIIELDSLVRDYMRASP